MKETRHLRISGRVQGVGYRQALCNAARTCGIAGWVRNRRDGTVEAVVQGSPGAIERILAWTRHGPPAAQVTEVRVGLVPGDLDRAYDGFDLLPTA